MLSRGNTKGVASLRSVSPVFWATQLQQGGDSCPHSFPLANISHSCIVKGQKRELSLSEPAFCTCRSRSSLCDIGFLLSIRSSRVADEAPFFIIRREEGEATGVRLDDPVNFIRHQTRFCQDRPPCSIAWRITRIVGNIEASSGAIDSQNHKLPSPSASTTVFSSSSCECGSKSLWSVTLGGRNTW